MAQSDDLATLTAIVMAQHQTDPQRMTALRLRCGLSTGEIAKRVGCTPGMLFAFMSGDAQPSTAQALAVLKTLYSQRSAPPLAADLPARAGIEMAEDPALQRRARRKAGARP